MADQNRHRYIILAGSTAVLLLTFALALTSMAQISPTFDEQGFIVRGLAYLRGQNRQLRVGHPLGLNALNAALLVGDETVRLPTGAPSWSGTSFHRPAEMFLWENGNDVEHIMFLARLPSLWLGLLLAAIAGRWGWRLTRRRDAGLLALALVALDPNILASARLATTDLGLALGATLAGFTLWRFWQRPSWRQAIVAGIGFGLLQNTKFTAGLFVPLFALVMLVGLLVLWREGGRFPSRPWLMILVAYPLAAFISLWAAYGFQVGTLPAGLPIWPQLGGLTLPLSHHLEQLLDIGGRLQTTTPAFLAGEYSPTGWWYYFPVAFILKTPLPVLILLAVAFIARGATYIQAFRRPHARPVLAARHIFNDAALLVPGLGYFAIALSSEINLGYRHLLPLLPFTAVFIAHALADARSGLRFLRPAVLALVSALLLATLSIHPHYLSYFNLLAGGPDNGWRYLVDSNIDWGQDLGALKTWMDENGVDEVWLSYFGEARPGYYGITYRGLDSWPPRLMNPQARPYYPPEPAPGIYAISATNLQGVHFANPDQFATFRDQEPIGKIGYSIFLYEVPASGGPVDLVLAGLQLDEIAPPDYDQFNSNDVIPRWVDPAQAMIVPASPRRWLALAGNTAVSPPLAALSANWPLRVAREDYSLYQITDLTIPDAEPLAVFTSGDGEIRLMFAFVDTAVPGQDLRLSTGWQQAGPPQPVKIFIHLLDSQGEIAAQWDGLGAAWEGWRSGDALLHMHALPLPADLPAGVYKVRLGLYHPQSGTRWVTAVGDDFTSLGEIELGR